MPSDQPTFDIPSIEQLTGGQALSDRKELQAQTSTRASQVLTKHHDALMGRKGVTMIGEGVDARGQPAIVVGVENAKDLKGLPQEIDGIPIITQVTGAIKAQ
jgi:hypothetical protein